MSTRLREPLNNSRTFFVSGGGCQHDVSTCDEAIRESELPLCKGYWTAHAKDLEERGNRMFSLLSPEGKYDYVSR